MIGRGSRLSMASLLLSLARALRRLAITESFVFAVVTFLDEPAE
jgi:hypothetical protein